MLCITISPMWFMAIGPMLFVTIGTLLRMAIGPNPKAKRGQHKGDTRALAAYDTLPSYIQRAPHAFLLSPSSNQHLRPHPPPCQHYFLNPPTLSLQVHPPCLVNHGWAQRCQQRGLVHVLLVSMAQLPIHPSAPGVHLPL